MTSMRRASIRGWTDPYGANSARTRQLTYVSGVLVIAASVVFAVTVGSGWSWPFFLWGLAVGLLSIGCFEFLLRTLTTVLQLSSDDRTKAQTRLGYQRAILRPAGVALGCAVGVISASSRTPWVDLFATAAIVIFQVLLPLALVPWLKRVQSRRAAAEPRHPAPPAAP